MIFASASFLFIFLPIFIFVYYLIPTVFCFLKKKNADLGSGLIISIRFKKE